MRKDVQKIWEWLAIADAVEMSDVIICFGGSSLSIPQKGLDLFQKHFAPYILATAGRGTFSGNWGMSDADKFAQYLEARNVQATNILIENKSSNTLENVLFSMRLLKNKNIPHNSIILVSMPLHQRRVFATCIKQYPQIRYINCPASEIPPRFMSEEELMHCAKRCLQEYERLKLYAAKEDIEKQKISDEIKQAYANIKQRMLLR